MIYKKNQWTNLDFLFTLNDFGQKTREKNIVCESSIWIESSIVIESNI